MKLRTIVFVLTIIALLALVKIFFLSPKKEQGKQTMSGAKPPTNVSIYIAHENPIENRLYATGTLQANEQIELRPEIAGKLTSIFFQEGKIVQKGTLLAKINDADLQAQLKRLKYQYQLASDKANRLKSLLNIQGISLQEYEDGANQLQLIQADMDFVKAQIAKTEIHAPFSGRVGLRQVSVGSFVNSNSVLATIQEVNRLKIDFPMPENNMNFIKIGDRVQFKLDNTDEIYFAKVYAMEPKINEQTREFLVRALCEQSNPNTMPGAFARVEIVPTQKQMAIMIPTESVIPELKGKKVFVVKSSMATPTPIKTGIRNDAMIEVLEGLAEGDSVIVTGIMSLKPNDKVAIKEVKNNN